MAPSAAEVERQERALARSIFKRDKCVDQILILYNMAKNVENDNNVLPLFSARRKDLESLMVDFRLDQDAIMDHLLELGRSQVFTEVHVPIETLVTEQYYFIQAIGASLECCKNDVSPRIGSHINLPKISLPHFDGNIINWRSFRDTFTSLVHENPNLTNVERFHYLISSVSGTGSAVVRSVPLSDTNYAVAWRALHDRFNNIRLIVHAHLDKLFGFSPLAKESLNDLRNFLNVFQENTAAIEALGIQDLSGFLLFYLASRVLDTSTKRLFESEHDTSQLPTLDKLLTFVQSRCQVLQNSSMTSTPVVKLNHVQSHRKTFPIKSSFLGTTTDRGQTCNACHGLHPIYRCDKFRKLAPSSRLQLVRSNNMCTNCLSNTHTVLTCSSKYTCRLCSERHHSFLHIDTHKTQTGSSSKKTEHSLASTAETSSSPSQEPPFVGTVSSPNHNVLGTAIIRIKDQLGHWVPVRALIDSGSQISAITNGCATRLSLKRYHCSTTVVGLSQQPVTNVKGVINCTVIPRTAIHPKINCQAVIMSNICGSLPAQSLNPRIRLTYADLWFADPNFDQPGPVDLLLGADIYNKLFINNYQVLHHPGLPSAFETIFGWIFVGSSSENTTASYNLSLLSSTTPSIEQLLRQFWEVEEPVVTTDLATEDHQCETLFCDTTTRDSTGRYSVSLPFRDDPSSLGNSRDTAVMRFYNLERKLLREPDVYQAYSEFMKEYERLGHMRLASQPGKYLIPHHAVTKQHNGILKLRVVFDASARTSSGRSLNELLYTGPKLQNNITDLLLRCRLHRFMFTADICKMYRQIKVNLGDRVYQHIFWRNSPYEPLKEFELTTVTYGVSSSPFQAIRVLQQLERDHGHEAVHAGNVLSSQTYVDDIITGANTIADVLHVQQDIIHLLSRGGFELKKWASNCPKVLNSVPSEDHVSALSFDPKDDSSVKILGLHWDPHVDFFSYHTSPLNLVYTKREILSQIAKLYDPIGALAPITFWAKSYMQLLWQAGYSWDAPLNEDAASLWKSFASQLHFVSQIKIRRYIPIGPEDDVQLFGFSDASLKGYAAVIYIRVKTVSGVSSIYFLTAKSKVAPVKTTKVADTLTMPRLELCGALLLAQLIHRVQQVFQSHVTFSSIRAWTDSTIVLSWLTSKQVQFKVFVTNRLTKIMELIPLCQWGHVRSEDNPADCVSRGLFPREAIDHDLYWNGPVFIHNWNEQQHAKPFSSIAMEKLPERISNQEYALVSTVLPFNLEWLQRFSSLTRLQRVTAYMHRFILRSKKQTSLIGYLRKSELDQSLHMLVKLTQQQYFYQLHHSLNSSTSNIISPRSVARLSPYLDNEGIIRVGGRLQHSLLPESVKHPILLPKSCVLSSLLIKHYHTHHLHAGPQLVSSLIHQRFWIVSSRSIIRQIIFKCVVCTRHRASINPPIMADLPPSRVCPSRPFLKVGVDYAGPFMIKDGKRKQARSMKCYIAIFVCMVVKAVHIEVVSELNTNAFIAALNRFVSRRGLPSDIFSDCGTNFQGANRDLQRLFSDPIAQDLCAGAILCKWHFNPPASPHFGGLWEAAVKSCKYHLKRVVGSQLLTFEEMSTLTSRIEAILNSRPITPQSSDPHDLLPLTPGHFLIGSPIVAIPQPDLTSYSPNRLNRWQLLNLFHQAFWKRWSLEYLTHLQSRGKWIRPNLNINVGDLIILHVPNLPPTSWKMGRVELVHPGTDGVVRVVTVRTSDGTYKRPVTKLTVLPIHGDS